MSIKLKTDNEICTNEAKEFVLEGFRLELMYNPNSPHQNGPSDRGNRIVSNNTFGFEFPVEI